MKFKVIWKITAYDVDVFLWERDQEPFEVEAETINEVIRKAKTEAGEYFPRRTKEAIISCLKSENLRTRKVSSIRFEVSNPMTAIIRFFFKCDTLRIIQKGDRIRFSGY